MHKPAAAAVGERTATEHLARSLRVLAVMRPDGKAREILGVDQAMRTSCSRPGAARSPRRPPSWSRAFEQRYGREPNALERDRLQPQAWAITRPRKSHDGETLEQRLDRWEQQLRAEINVDLDSDRPPRARPSDRAGPAWRRRSTRPR